MSADIEKNGRVSEIIFSDKMSRLFDPLASKTLDLEKKLAELEISLHRIQGVTPIGNTNALRLPPNSGYKTIGKDTLILAPNGRYSIEVIDLVKSHK